jgi:hypothetical protein
MALDLGEIKSLYQNLSNDERKELISLIQNEKNIIGKKEEQTDKKNKKKENKKQISLLTDIEIDLIKIRKEVERLTNRSDAVHQTRNELLRKVDSIVEADSKIQRKINDIEKKVISNSFVGQVFIYGFIFILSFALGYWYKTPLFFLYLKVGIIPVYLHILSWGIIGFIIGLSFKRIRKATVIVYKKQFTRTA